MDEIPRSLWKLLLRLTSGAASLCKYRNVRTLLSETERKPIVPALIDSQYKPEPADPQKGVAHVQGQQTKASPFDFLRPFTLSALDQKSRSPRAHLHGGETHSGYIDIPVCTVCSGPGCDADERQLIQFLRRN